MTIFERTRYTKFMVCKRKRALSLPSSVVAMAETLARMERRSVGAVVSTALRAYAKTKGGQGNGTRTRASQQTGQDLWTTIVGPFADLPAGVLRKLPRDVALNHDHCIYGQP